MADREMSAEKETARLIIADDHDLMRFGIKRMLEGQPGFEVIGEATNGREAVELCRTSNPDLALMDVRMPEMDGLKATRKIKRYHPRVAVLMITAFEDEDYLFEALKAGAAGYVLKHATQEELASAVRQVLSGELPLDSQLASGLLKRLATEVYKKPAEPRKSERSHLHEALTPREMEVLGLLAQGRTNREIACELLISFGTVKANVRHILFKLDASDRTQAAVRAAEFGLLPLEQ